MKAISRVASSIVAVLATSALAKDSAKPPHMVTEAEAKAMAQKTYRGAVKSGELEFENGRWIYSFDIADVNGGSTTHEVNVDAITGKVVSQQIENSQDEKNEEAHEAQKANSPTLLP